jgi:hypothetical protein
MSKIGNMNINFNFTLFLTNLKKQVDEYSKGGDIKSIKEVLISKQKKQLFKSS